MLIDCLDTEGTWYKSTVLEVRHDEGQDGQLYKKVKVGFRYFTEDGNKTDETNGRKYVGWYNKYDEWKSVIDITIQPEGSIRQYYTIVYKNSLTYDSVDDLADPIYCIDHTVQYSKARKKNSKLSFAVEHVNQFGLRGGFDNLLAYLEN